MLQGQKAELATAAGGVEEVVRGLREQLQRRAELERGHAPASARREHGCRRRCRGSGLPPGLRGILSRGIAENPDLKLNWHVWSHKYA